jgi:hypothetical protein
MRANQFIRGRKPRQRHVKGSMNLTEKAYAELLEGRKLAGEILGWRFEAYKLRLADNTYFTADFMVQLPNGEIQLHEVKVRMKSGKRLIEDDAAVKIKVAADQYPEFQFALVTLTKKTGAWDYEWLR